jgi:hypothetical protein
MDRSRQWLTATDARWNDTLKRWAFPSGATLAFGYLETDADTYRYQSAEFQLIGFDELTEFTEAQYTYLFSRLRRPSEGPLAEVPFAHVCGVEPGRDRARLGEEALPDRRQAARAAGVYPREDPGQPTP